MEVRAERAPGKPGGLAFDGLVRPAKETGCRNCDGPSRREGRSRRRGKDRATSAGGLELDACHSTRTLVSGLKIDQMNQKCVPETTGSRRAPASGPSTAAPRTFQRLPVAVS